MIATVIDNMTAKQSKIIGYTLNKAYKAGAKEGDKIISKASITAAAATVGFDMSKVADTHLNKITGDTIGSIGKYNKQLSKQLTLEYKALLSDNRLINSLSKDGWTPWLDKALEKRGVSAEVIALAKGQTTTKKIVGILEMEGIKGGRHPREVSKMLIPHVQRYFGPSGVVIDNVGKYRKELQVTADSKFQWVQKKIIKPYRATPKAYSNLLARSSMLLAHNTGRTQSLDASGLVSGYRWSCLCSANSCVTCLGMHGQKITKAEFPPAHPDCGCHGAPIFKKDSGIKNKSPDFYFKQRDTAMYRKFELEKYNKTLPKGTPKLKFDTLLPEGTVGSLPDAKEMHDIRKALLK